MNDDTAMVLLGNVRPKSRGRIHLRSADPADHPVIDPRYYSHPDDAKVALEAIKLAEKIVKSEPMRKFKMTETLAPHPLCKDEPLNSDSYFQCLIDHNSLTMYHPVGTCKMGPQQDRDAVVDPQLR